MATALNIVNGSTTTQLAANTTNGIYLLGYVPSTPKEETTEFVSPLMDGGELPIAVYRNVTESAEVLITASSKANFADVVAEIEAAAQQARIRQRTRTVTPVYVHFQPDGYTDTYRSEILSLSIDFDEAALDTQQWGNTKVEAQITWTRRFYWEDTTETTIPLNNDNGTNLLTPITIYNHDDADVGHDNWVRVGVNGMGGTLPTPIRLEYVNTYASTGVKKLRVWQNLLASPTSLSHVLESDAATGGANTADAGASNGSYRARNTTTTAEITLLTWTVAAAQASVMLGNPFMFLLRLWSDPSPTTVKFWIEVQDTDGTLLWEGEHIQAVSGRQVYELGSTMLPASMWNMDTIAGFNIVLKGQNTVSATNTYDIDYVMLAALDDFKAYNLIVTDGVTPTGLSNGDTLVDEGMTGQLYVLDPTNKRKRFSAREAPLMVWPGRQQKFYFLATDLNDNAVIARTATVQMFARARRLSL